MRKLKTKLIVLLTAATKLCAEEFEINLSLNDDIFVQVQPEDSFQDVIGMIRRHAVNYNDNEDFRIDFAISGSVVEAKAVLTGANSVRNFSIPVSEKEKEDVRLILRTLANGSLLKIGASESSLKKAGERIDSIHPLRFLEFVFSDEELKVCMHNLQGRNWVWKEFTTGIVGSLSEEYGKGNLKPEFIQSFAKTVKIPPSAINAPIQNQRWLELLDVLITKIPREKGSDRYNM